MPSRPQWGPPNRGLDSPRSFPWSPNNAPPGRWWHCDLSKKIAPSRGGHTTTCRLQQYLGKLDQRGLTVKVGTGNGTRPPLGLVTSSRGVAARLLGLRFG